MTQTQTQTQTDKTQADPRELYARALQQTAGIVAAVEPNQLTLPDAVP
jgi:hypothetical protein